MADRPLTSANPPPKWTELNDLANQDVGGKIVFATDDWFAAAENLLVGEEPVWKEGFTDQGKWMDGWETRRKRIPGHDWCIIRLGLPGVIAGVELATDFFTGNFAPKASIQAARLSGDVVVGSRTGHQGKAATAGELKEVENLGSDAWKVIVPVTSLGAGYKDTSRTYINVDCKDSYTHLRLNIYPDGGVARLRVYGVCRPEVPPSPGQVVDLAAAALGGVCVGYSDAHYGHPRNMIREGRGKNMGDGWETARKLDRPSILTADANGILQVPGSDWACFQLGLPGKVERIEVDTNHFKGNYPDSVVIDGAKLQEGEGKEITNEKIWVTLLPAQKLQPHLQHYFGGTSVHDIGTITHIRVRMFPDGGISRVRIHGVPELGPAKL